MMKRTLRDIAAVVTGCLWLCACSDDAIEDRNSAVSQSDRISFAGAIEDDGTRAVVSEEENRLTVHWAEDDTISVFLADNDTHYSATLDKASAGSTSGSFTVDQNIGITENDNACHYAAYPYNASNSLTADRNISVKMPAVQSYNDGSFGGLTAYMTAFCPAKRNFSFYFQPFIGAICLQLKGNATIGSVRLTARGGEYVCGTATVAIPYDEGPVADMSNGGNSVVFDCGSIDLRPDAVREICIVLPAQNYTEGITVDIIDENGETLLTRTAYTKEGFDLKRRVIKMMPELTVNSATIDLSAEGSANCYVVDDAGRYKFATKRVDGTAVAGSYDVVDWIWRTEGVELTDIEYKEGYIYFTVGKFVAGNASIGAFDNSQRAMLGSWHIWLTDKPQDISAYGTAYSFLDRNIGATSTDAGDKDSYGLLYQWGRKDPWRNHAQGSVNNKPEVNPLWSTVVGSSTYWSDWNINPKSWCSFSTINNYPISFMSGYTNSMRTDSNWFNYTSQSASVYNYMWSSRKTNYDPCPAGYRVPAMAEWDSVDFSIGDSGNIGITIVNGRSYSVLPAQGYVMYDGTVRKIGTEMTVWTTEAEQYYQTQYGNRYLTLNAHCLSYVLDSYNITDDAVNRTFACPVRCVKQ